MPKNTPKAGNPASAKMNQAVTLEAFFSGRKYRTGRAKLWTRDTSMATIQVKALINYNEENDLFFLTFQHPTEGNMLIFSGALNAEVAALEEEVGETITAEVAWYIPVPDWTEDQLQAEYGNDESGRAAIRNYQRALKTGNVDRLTLVGLVE